MTTTCRRVPMSGYRVAHLDEIEEASDGLRPIRLHLGITAFGVNAFIGRHAGDRIVKEHDEANELQMAEELYLVQTGRARFELDGEQVDAPAGTLVFAGPAVKRAAVAEEPGTTILVVGASQGKAAYQASGWELWAPLSGDYEQGAYDRVIPRAREVADANPQYPVLKYNLACCESLAGHSDDAIEHLRQAIGESAKTGVFTGIRSFAAGDSDFDSIRDESAFKELVG
jgi:tetratricopeptide (TPR) repeat protein